MKENVKYELMTTIEIGGTVGSLAIGYEQYDFDFGKGTNMQMEDFKDNNGWAKLFIPNFDNNRIYVLCFRSLDMTKFKSSKFLTLGMRGMSYCR